MITRITRIVIGWITLFYGILTVFDFFMFPPIIIINFLLIVIGIKLIKGNPNNQRYTSTINPPSISSSNSTSENNRKKRCFFYFLISIPQITLLILELFPESNPILRLSIYLAILFTSIFPQSSLINISEFIFYGYSYLPFTFGLVLIVLTLLLVSFILSRVISKRYIVDISKSKIFEYLIILSLLSTGIAFFIEYINGYVFMKKYLIQMYGSETIFYNE